MNGSKRYQRKFCVSAGQIVRCLGAFGGYEGLCGHRPCASARILGSVYCLFISNADLPAHVYFAHRYSEGVFIANCRSGSPMHVDQVEMTN